MKDRSLLMSLVAVSATLVATSMAGAQELAQELPQELAQELAQNLGEESQEIVSDTLPSLSFEPPAISAPDLGPSRSSDSVPTPLESSVPALDGLPSTLSPDAAPVVSNPVDRSPSKDALDDATDDATDGPKDLSLSREQLTAIFQGDLSSLPAADKLFPPQASFGAFPSSRDSGSTGGNSLPKGPSSFGSTGGFGVPPASRGMVSSNGTTLKRTPEQSLAIMVTEVEKQIARHNRELNESKDDQQQEALLKKLGESYQLRFELDTAFQDYKVAEIERRAKKLRADVEAREKATQQWVDAMVTLAKMKANGIETMNSNSAPFAPVSVQPIPNTHHVPSSGFSSY